MIIIRSIVWILAAAVCTALLMPAVDAAELQYDLNLSLNPAHIQSDRWSPGSQPIQTTSLREGDTLRVNFDFGGASLRWTDTGADREYLVFGLWTESNGNLGIRSDVSISLTDPSGAFNIADFAGSANGTGVAISGNTMVFGEDNITDGIFDFTGITIEFANLVDRGLTSGSGLPEEFNRISLSAIGGSFSIVGANMNVPIPAAALLFPSGLLAGLAWMRRRLGPAST